MKTIENQNTKIFFLSEERDSELLSKSENLKGLINQNKRNLFFYFDELKNKKTAVRNILSENNKIIIGARNCIIKEPSVNEKSDFLKKYHIQGNDKSNIFLGLYYTDELISLISFNTNEKFCNRTEEPNTYNLTRYCVKSKYSIVGGFNRLLTNFIRKYNPKKIITYANLRYVSEMDNVYVRNGFKLTRRIPPDYYYYDGNKILHKFGFGKTNLSKKHGDIDLNKTENELTKELGLERIYDLGKLRYEMLLDDNNNIIFGYIYKITNNVNGKIYIGQTTRDISKRIYEYKKYITVKGSSAIHAAIYKYGWDNFNIKIIDSAKNLTELNEKEILYIKKYKSLTSEFGYNIESGGNNSLPTSETLERMSKSHKGIKQNSDWVEKRISKAGSSEAKKYGKEKTEEEKKYLSENSPKIWLGKNRSEETKEKIRETKKLNGDGEKLKLLFSKKVYLKNPTTKEIIETFDTTEELALRYSVTRGSINRYCRDNKIKFGVLFTYER